MISFKQGFEKLCINFIRHLLEINEFKKYNERNYNFNNFILILRGIYEEISDINLKFLNELLKYYHKKEHPYNYLLTSKLLSLMKNLLATPINNFVLRLLTNDDNNSNDRVRYHI